MIFFIVFACGTIFTIVVNRLLLVFANNLGIRGSEKIQVRWASTSRPSLGGVAFFLSFLGIIALMGLSEFQYVIFSKKQFIGIFLACSAGFAVGFADDTYNTNPQLKLLGQIICALILFYFDIRIEIGSFWLDFAITIFWIVGLMNSINMLDNMDAVTAIVSVLILLSAVIVFLETNYYDEIILTLICGIVGSLIGFLYHNWPPAKMYMGDAGSQFLGIFLAVISIRVFWSLDFISFSGFFNQLIVPSMIFVIPIIDTITVIYYRLKNNKNPFVGGTDHTTHHLVFSGISNQKILLYIIVNNFAIFLLLIYNLKNSLSLICNLISVVYIILIFFVIQIKYKKGLRLKDKKRDKIYKTRRSRWDLIVNKLFN